MIKVLIAEDNDVFRNGIRALLERSESYKVIGEATSSNQVFAMFNDGVIPDILLTDINVGRNDPGLISIIKSNFPDVKIVMLSMADNERAIVKTFRDGASGYLLKSVTADELLFSIKHINFEGRYVCSELALRFLDRLVRLPDPAGDINPDNIDFSDRELEVLELIAQGLTNQQIADVLFTSKRTVEGYRKSMLIKCEAPNTAALIRYAMRNNILN